MDLPKIADPRGNLTFVEERGGFFSRRPLLLSFTLTILFIASFWIRVYRITDPPLDFHPVRQYFGALVARSYYYSYRGPSAPQWMRTVAACQDPRTIAEPPILEGITLPLYSLAGGEEMWIPRFLSSLFWLLGGAPLYLLAKRIGSMDAAVVSTGFYLLLPYGVYASRALMPNPLMVMMLLSSILMIVRHNEKPSAIRAATAGTVAALATLVQPFPSFLILGAFGALAVQRHGVRKSALDPHCWVFLLVALVVPATYYGYTVLFAGHDTEVLAGHLQPRYLLDALSYKYWLAHIQTVVGFGALILALLGVLMFRRGVARALVVGLWCGYIVYAVVFIYHMRTHDYYQLPLIPLVALSLGPVGAVVLARLDQIGRRWHVRAASLSILAFAMILALGVSASELGRQDFDHQVRIYEEVGEAVHHSTNTVYLTEHYGFALEYHGWLSGKNWPCAAYERAYGLPGLSDVDAEQRFLADYAGGSPEYFIITNLKDYEEQADLRSYLTQNFPITAQTEDYLVFDLSRPVKPKEDNRYQESGFPVTQLPSPLGAQWSKHLAPASP